MKKELISKIKRIKVLAMDVDGVLTNGAICIDHKGREIKVFDVQDGFGIAIFRNSGYKTVVITARSSGAVSERTKALKITKVFQDAYPKINAYKQMLKALKVKDSEVCFVGDDLPDICVLNNVGFSVAVNNATTEVKKVVDYVTKKTGGSGAIREVIELIMKTQGKWKEVMENFNYA